MSEVIDHLMAAKEVDIISKTTRAQPTRCHATGQCQSDDVYDGKKRDLTFKMLADDTISHGVIWEIRLSFELLASTQGQKDKKYWPERSFVHEL